MGVWPGNMKNFLLTVIVGLSLTLPLVEGLFFGPVAIGLGLGLLAVKTGFFLGAALSGGRSRRSYRRSRSYSYRPSNHYRTTYYAKPSRHYYYSSRQYYSHHGKRSADQLEELHRVRREVEANGFNLTAWYEDMTEKDQDDCGKLLVCELRAKEQHSFLTENEKTIADYFGNGRSVDVGEITVEFDLAAQVGKNMGKGRCQELYGRRCDTTTEDMVAMIEKEYEDMKKMEQDISSIGDVDQEVLSEKENMIKELTDNGIDPGQIWN